MVPDLYRKSLHLPPSSFLPELLVEAKFYPLAFVLLILFSDDREFLARF